MPDSSEFIPSQCTSLVELGVLLLRQKILSIGTKRRPSPPHQLLFHFEGEGDFGNFNVPQCIIEDAIHYNRDIEEVIEREFS